MLTEDLRQYIIRAFDPTIGQQATARQVALIFNLPLATVEAVWAEETSARELVARQALEDGQSVEAAAKASRLPEHTVTLLARHLRFKAEQAARQAEEKAAADAAAEMARQAAAEKGDGDAGE